MRRTATGAQGRGVRSYLGVWYTVDALQSFASRGPDDDAPKVGINRDLGDGRASG